MCNTQTIVRQNFFQKSKIVQDILKHVIESKTRNQKISKIKYSLITDTE